MQNCNYHWNNISSLIVLFFVENIINRCHILFQMCFWMKAVINLTLHQYLRRMLPSCIELSETPTQKLNYIVSLECSGCNGIFSSIVIFSLENQINRSVWHHPLIDLDLKRENTLCSKPRWQFLKCFPLYVIIIAQSTFAYILIKQD